MPVAREEQRLRALPSDMPFRGTSSRWIAAPGLFLALVSASCARGDSGAGELAIGPLEPVASTAAPQRLFATSTERFGLAMPGVQKTAPLAHVTPPEWKERPPNGMRALDFQVGESATDECTVTVLAGDAGGLLANVGRWCGQLGVKPWTQEELDRAPPIDMLGSQGVLVVLGDEAGPRAVLGAIGRQGDRSVFVKLAASRAVALAQRPAFESFCASLGAKN